ncbi:MAG: hypothetical protein RLZZ399_3052 [Verrucomicrobiota bacterium]|jgi:hypothetical protein
MDKLNCFGDPASARRLRGAGVDDSGIEGFLVGVVRSFRRDWISESTKSERKFGIRAAGRSVCLGR